MVSPVLVKAIERHPRHASSRILGNISCASPQASLALSLAGFAKPRVASSGQHPRQDRGVDRPASRRYAAAPLRFDQSLVGFGAARRASCAYSTGLIKL